MTQQQKIIDCEKQLIQAIKINDIKMLDALLHEDLIFNIPTGQSITKSMDIENYRSGGMIVSEIIATDQIIKIFDNISIVNVTIHLKAKYEGQMIAGKYKYLRVWKIFDKSWKVIAGSAYSL